jgi:hypothetical protein
MVSILSSICKKNMIIISHRSQTEKSCLLELKKYWQQPGRNVSEEIIIKNQKMIDENKNKNKCLSCSIKPESCNLAFFP